MDGIIIARKIIFQKIIDQRISPRMNDLGLEKDLTNLEANKPRGHLYVVLFDYCREYG